MNEKERKKIINNRLKAHYKYIESLGYEVVGIFLQGSQNYNLDIYEDEYTSDVDTKCLVIPTLDNLIKGNTMVSKKYDFENEQIDVKDIRVMMEMWKKQNQSYLEILFTKYKKINPKYKDLMKKILDMKNDIVRINPPQLARCISGMSKEKVVALEHPYPATIKKIEKYGYDPKQLASIIRLTHLIKNFFVNEMSFDKSIIYTDEALKTYMIDVKKGKVPLEEARELSLIYDSKTAAIKDSIVEEYGKDCFNNKICETLESNVFELVKYGILTSIKKSFEIVDNFIYFSKEEQEAEQKIIDSLSIEPKDNIFDYYGDDK